MICFEGAVSVKAVLLAKRREVKEIWVDAKKKDRNTAFILRQAALNKVPVFKKNREEIDIVAQGKTHGGLIAFALARENQKVKDCLKKEVPFLALLEGIEDPFNLGYALRTLYAAGCDGVLMPPRDWTKVESTIVKSSAGASEFINCCFPENMQEAIQQCKQAGCQLFCAMRKDAINYVEADFKQPLLLAIGGEMRGLSKTVLEESDQNIFIPYANDFRNALNASSAVACISFELVRQRQGGK